MMNQIIGDIITKTIASLFAALLVKPVTRLFNFLKDSCEKPLENISAHGLVFIDKHLKWINACFKALHWLLLIVAVGLTGSVITIYELGGITVQILFFCLLHCVYIAFTAFEIKKDIYVYESKEYKAASL